MTVPDLFGQSYDDPGLWPRLGKRIGEELESRADAVLSGKVKSLENYREQLGWIAGLRWVLNEARDLTTQKGDED